MSCCAVCGPATQRLVVDAFRAGLGPATVWDGLRLRASEILHRRPAAAARRHGPVHGVTEVNAFAYAFRAAKSEMTKRLMVLQAAGWLPLMRRDLERFFGAPEGEGLDVLGTAVEGEPPRIAELFEDPPVLELEEAIIRDRHPVSVTGQVGQPLLRAAQRRLAVHALLEV